MKVSLNWMKDYVKLPEDLTTSRLMYDLTMSTVEVEGAESMSDKFDKIVVGRVVELLPHPNADKLCICRTDIGDGELKEIVCGGINLHEGMNVAVSKPGAMVRWHGEGELVEIKNAKLRGVESYGMICASSEIGLFDLFPFEEQATILDLSGFDSPPGTPLHLALGIDDVVLEIDNKSLTNRPDLWGHYGIARELSAIYDLPLNDLPTATLPAADGGLCIAISAPERCARYAGLCIENVCTKPASFGIRSRLWLVGQRPINALVDITNYVMLAVGQPTHAFDKGNIKGGIDVRMANAGERLTLLNGKELALSPDDLVIADHTEVVALAGVMGGVKDSILPGTTNVILEVANFAPLGTRKTAQRHDLRTEASMRYEKGIDPQRVDQAIVLSAELFTREFPEIRITGYLDAYPRPLAPATVTVSLSWLARRMGKDLGESAIRAILGRLGFETTVDGNKLRATSPTWRSTGDISLPDDIMEEIARLYGYENFEPTAITTSFTGAINQHGADLERRIREYLSFRCGMQEIFTYPWVHDAYLNAVSSPDGALEIETPPAPDERYIRTSLLPNLLRAVEQNIRYFDAFSIYEHTQVFFDRDYTTPYDARERLPRQRKHLAGAFVDAPEKLADIFRSAKGVIEGMHRHVHMEPLVFRQERRPDWADETIWLNVYCGDTHAGDLALLSKKTALAVDIKQSAVMLFELDTDLFAPLPSRTNRYMHLPEYPQVEYDISMLFDSGVKWEEIERTIFEKRGPQDVTKSASFIDEYRGKQIPAGKKSVTFRLLLGSDEKTLTSEEIESAVKIVVKRLNKGLAGELRE